MAPAQQRADRDGGLPAAEQPMDPTGRCLRPPAKPSGSHPRSLRWIPPGAAPPAGGAVGPHPARFDGFHGGAARPVGGAVGSHPRSLRSSADGRPREQREVGADRDRRGHRQVAAVAPHHLDDERPVVRGRGVGDLVAVLDDRVHRGVDARRLALAQPGSPRGSPRSPRSVSTAGQDADALDCHVQTLLRHEGCLSCDPSCSQAISVEFAPMRRPISVRLRDRDSYRA